MSDATPHEPRPAGTVQVDDARGAVRGDRDPDSWLVSELRGAGCVFAEDEARLLTAAAASRSELRAMTERRVRGVPLEHVLGWAEFHGLRVSVRDGVFVPRRRTELLVDRAAPVTVDGANVVDLCCGSGAIGLALAALRSDLHVFASDVDPAAVACARDNLEPVGGRVFQGDLFAPLPPRLRGMVDVVVACAPYVPTRAIHHLPPEARDHEPRAALDGGDDGLDVVRRIAEQSVEWLAPGGHLLVETGTDQADPAAAFIAEHGLRARVEHAEGATVVIGSRPGSRCAWHA